MRSSAATTRPLEVIVIGAGIGGLAAACALQRRGIRVQVYEQARTLGAVGAGIQMSPNAVRVIGALGLGERLERAAFQANSIVGRDWKTGRTLYRTLLRDEIRRKYGANYLHVHRADLHAILLQAVGEGVVDLGRKCVEVVQSRSSAAVRFDDGSEAEADIVIGADGIHSAVRASLYGQESPVFTGNMCWRTLIPAAAVPDGRVSPDVSLWQGPGGHVVTYYVGSGQLVNVVAIKETPDWVEESWNVRSSREEMIDAYRGWHPDLIALLAQAQEVFRWGLFDREPMRQWTVGRVSLLGDAAHPMLPFIAQGAAMAIEDGYVLAHALARPDTDAAAALGAYEALRRPRTSRVQLAARERGRTYHLASPLAKLWRDTVYLVRGMVKPQATGLATDWIYAYDATSGLAAKLQS